MAQFGTSQYLSSKVLNSWFSNVAFTFGVTGFQSANFCYIAWLTSGQNATQPSMTGATITEATNSGNYVRTPVSIGPASATPAFPSIAVSVQTITNNVTLGTGGSGGATGQTVALGTINTIALIDSVTYGAGNMLMFGDLSASKTLGIGDIIQFLGGSPGNLSIQLS